MDQQPPSLKQPHKSKLPKPAALTPQFPTVASERHKTVKLPSGAATQSKSTVSQKAWYNAHKGQQTGDPKKDIAPKVIPPLYNPASMKKRKDFSKRIEMPGGEGTGMGRCYIEGRYGLVAPGGRKNESGDEKRMKMELCKGEGEERGMMANREGNEVNKMRGECHYHYR